MELRAPNNPYDFNSIARQSGAIKPMVFQGSPAALANPAGLRTPGRPVMEATLSQTGHTAAYACPWCGHQHRHRADARLRSGAVTSKATHCRTWRRLHPNAIDSVLIRLAGGEA